jgi:hypothetical protein
VTAQVSFQHPIVIHSPQTLFQALKYQEHSSRVSAPLWLFQPNTNQPTNLEVAD